MTSNRVVDVKDLLNYFDLQTGTLTEIARTNLK